MWGELFSKESEPQPAPLQLTPPCGGELNCSFLTSIDGLLQLTPLRGGELICKEYRCKIIKLQLTPPCGGEPMMSLEMLAGILLQLTPPRGGEQNKFMGGFVMNRFNSRPCVGANAFELDLLSVIFRYL